MSIRSSITITELNAQGALVPVTGATVQLYEYNASDPQKRGSLVGSFTEEGNGQYYIDLTRAIKGVVVVGGANLTSHEGKSFRGDTAMVDEVDTSSIQDDAVTTAKANFVDAY